MILNYIRRIKINIYTHKKLITKQAYVAFVKIQHLDIKMIFVLTGKKCPLILSFTEYFIVSM